MNQSTALMMVKLDPPEEQEDEWNQWYNKRHFTDRVALPGFLAGRRFTKMEGIPKEFAIAGEAKYLALYDLANVRVLKGAAYVALQKKEALRPADSFEAHIAKLPKFARGVYEQIYPEPGIYRASGSQFVQVVGHDVPHNRHREFNTWYNTEHIPALMAVPGFLAVRRFVLAQREIPPIVSRGGTISKYLTIWELEDGTTLESDAFRKAAMSPWTNWVRSWYTRRMCLLYRQIHP